MSSLNFNTSNQTFRQLLGNGLTYRVPPFQRDYSWTDDEWDEAKINARKNQLAGHVSAIWRMDFND